MYKRNSYISVDFFLLKNNIILKVCIDCVGSVVVVVSGREFSNNSYDTTHCLWSTCLLVHQQYNYQKAE